MSSYNFQHVSRVCDVLSYTYICRLLYFSVTITLKKEARVGNPFVSPPIHSEIIAVIQFCWKNIQH
jgi:hypothetical protein